MSFLLKLGETAQLILKHIPVLILFCLDAFRDGGRGWSHDPRDELLAPMNKGQRRAPAPQPPPSSVIVTHGWDWAAAALWKAAVAVPGERRCTLPTPDWVVLANDTALWFTTYKNGAIARKKLLLRRDISAGGAASSSSFPAAAISERFVRLASRWPTRAPYIGVLVFRDGARQVLTPVEFQHWLEKLDAASAAGASAPAAAAVAHVAGLQAYIPPCSDSQTASACVSAMYRSDSHVLTGSNGRVDVVSRRDAYSATSHISTNDSGSAPEVSARVRKAAESAVLALVDALERAVGAEGTVYSVAVEFVVDWEQRLWLTHVERVDVTTEQPPSVMLGGRKPSLPALPTTLTSTGDSSNNLVAKCRGEFCRTPPAQLAGLFADSQNDSQATAADTTADVLPDTGARVRIGYNSVQLAHAELDFLVGRARRPSEAPAALALRWQEADNGLRTQFGRANPTQFYQQVPVCANCHRVYAALNRARDNGFALGTGTADASRDDDNDRLFLVELAKHDVSSGDTVSNPPPALEPHGGTSAASPARPELEGRPSSRSERQSRLPSLSSVAVATNKQKTAKTKTKKAPLALAVRTSNNNNNQRAFAVDETEEAAVDENEADEGEEKASSSELAHLRATVALLGTQKRAAEQRCLLVQAQCTTQLAAKDEQARKQRLALELAHSERLQPPLPVPAAARTIDEMGKLIETIEALHTELDSVGAQSALELQQLAATHQRELKQLHERYQREIETLRLSEHAAIEQVEAAQLQLASVQSEAQVAASQARATKAALAQLREHTLVPLEEKNRRLERQVAELSAGVAATPSTTTAASEQSERQLLTKVEYLKATLASELTCKEELGSHLAQVTAALETLKEEKRQALQAQDDACRRQLQNAEAAAALEKDAAAAQLAALQGKLVALQANTADLVQELTLSKSREAHARLAVDKVAEENTRLARQIADLESHVEALADARQRDPTGSDSSGRALSTGMSAKTASDETQRLQTDALLRRLDNERQYLTNLLADAQETATTRQQQVAALERDVVALTRRLESDAVAAEEALAAEMASRRSVERELQDALVCVEESKQLLARQLQDAHAKLATAREQALVTRDELEKRRLETHEARTQLAAATDALATERSHAKSASERSSQALALVKRSLEAVEDEKAVQLGRLEDENARVVAQLAHAQSELLVLGDTWAADATRKQRQHAMEGLARTLGQHWAVAHARMQARAWRRLAVHTALEQQTETLRAAHAIAAGALEERLRNEFMDQCDAVTQSLSDERMDVVRQLKARHDTDRTTLHVNFEHEKQQLAADATRALDEQAERLTQAHTLALAALDERHAVQVTALDTELAARCAERDAVADTVTELQTRVEALHTQLDAQTSDAARVLATQTAAWTQEALAMRAEHDQQTAEAAALAATTERQHASQLLAFRETHARESGAIIQQAVDDARAQVAEHANALTETHRVELAALEAAHEHRVAEAVEQVTGRWERELQDVQVAHAAALQQAIERVEKSAESRLDALQKELLERKGQAVMQCTAKWQRALEELQARLDTETRAAYDNGLRDREAEWQQAAALIKRQQQYALEHAQLEAVRAVEAAEERHAMRFDALLVQRTRELEDAHARDVARVTVEITDRVEQRASAEQAAQVQQLTQAWQAEHTQELEAMRSEYQQALAMEREALTAAAEIEKTIIMERCDAGKLLALADAKSEWEQKVEALETVVREKDAYMERALDALRCELSDDYAHDAEQLRATLASESATRLKELETRLRTEHEEAIAQVQDDSEQVIEKVELAMTQLTAQKDAMETELEQVRRALEEAEDAHFDSSEQLQHQRKRAAFHMLSLLLHARRRIESDAQTHGARLLALQVRLDQFENDRTREQTTRSAELAQARMAWHQVQSKHDEMFKTLTSYKRDELVAHRSAGGVLANEISIVGKQMDEVREMRSALEKEIEALQSEAQSVEASLRQVMVQSAASTSSESSGGNSGSSALNMAVVAKKRRLNEEFEALLEQVERKKAELRSIEKTFSALQTRRDAKEQEMKVMERKLVEILVQQQKQVLALLSTVRELSVPAALTQVNVAVVEVA